jgi:hypothetical protein
MRLVLALLGSLVVVPAYAQPSAGAAPPAPTNDDCMMCHSDPEAKRADGSPVAVDADRFAASVHGQLELTCTDCHASLAAAELPHPEDLPKAECSACHDTAVTAYGASVHARARAADAPRGATCADCHGAHDIQPSSEPQSRTYHLNLARTCGACHGEQAPGARMPGGNVLAQFQDSIHGHALSRSGLLVAPSCASCHGAHDIRDNASAESRVHRTNVPGMCGDCHAGVERIYRESIHGQLAAQGSARAPVCIDCHTAHEVQRAQQDEFRLRVVSRACGECHEESLATYRDTFHGQVTELGYAEVATCADCHSAHAQFPQSDPRSRVAPQNRLKTCQQCHPSATANFAQYDPHADAHSHERSALLYYSGRFMQLLLAGVFGFFGIHTGLWFARSLKELRARRAGDPGADEVTDDAARS